MTLRCPSCDYDNDDSDVVCMGCGYPIGNEMPDDIMVQDDDVEDASVLDEEGEIEPDVADSDVYDEAGELIP